MNKIIIALALVAICAVAHTSAGCTPQDMAQLAKDMKAKGMKPPKTPADMAAMAKAQGPGKMKDTMEACKNNAELAKMMAQGFFANAASGNMPSPGAVAGMAGGR